MGHNKPLPAAELRRIALKECVRVIEQLAERLSVVSSYVLDGQHDRVRKLVAENWTELAGTLATASTTMAQVRALLHQDPKTIDYSHPLVMMRRYLIEEEQRRPAWLRFFRRWGAQIAGGFLYPTRALRTWWWNRREHKRLAWIRTLQAQAPAEVSAPPVPPESETSEAP